MTWRFASIALVCFFSVWPGKAHADVVRDWNTIMVNTVEGQNPFAQARFAAVTQLAVFEAVNAIIGGYEPYLDPIVAPPDASVEAAAVAAAHRVLIQYLPAAASALEAARTSSLAAIPDGAAKNDGIAVGEAAAAAMIALRASDGSGPPQFFPPSAPAPGEWQATQGCPPAGGILFHWQYVTPFGIRSSTQFRSAPPPALTSRKYSRDYQEVRTIGGAGSLHRPEDRATVAQFYNAVLAVGVWNRVAQQLSEHQGSSLLENARAFALINMAISDALVTVMETKYHYTFWRPATAIPAGDVDGNPHTQADTSFVPFIPTPCFPSYPSAHASASYAARSVVQRFWGAGGHWIVLTHPSLPQVTLQYSRLKEITEDIDDARVYGGIHFRFDQMAGAHQGLRIGGYVYGHNLRPLYQQ
jgi:hypothetical protein